MMIHSSSEIVEKRCGKAFQVSSTITRSQDSEEEAEARQDR